MSDVLRNPAERTADLPTAAAPQPGGLVADLPDAELRSLAASLGMQPDQYQARQHLVAAVHQRRRAIAAVDPDAFVEAMTWARRWVSPGATKEQVAAELSQVRSMRFTGLSQRGLVALAVVRGIPVRGDEAPKELVHQLKKREGLFAKLGRKRRALLGSIVSKMIGDTGEAPQSAESPTAPPTVGQPNARPATIKHYIEDAGLLGGLAGHVRRSADTYVNQKLDEIEARIDRKLNDIDHRLAEWRDKEIANRLRILKITLWASIVVGAFSLVYAYVQLQLHPIMPDMPKTAVHPTNQR